MEIDTKIKKIIEDIKEKNIDLNDTKKTVEECIELLKLQCNDRKYLKKYVEQIEHLYMVSKFGSEDQIEIRLIQSRLKDILENSSLKNGKYHHETEGKVVEAMRFEDDIDKVKFFCIPHSVTISKVCVEPPSNWNIYALNIFKPREYIYKFLLLECLDMLVKYEYSLVNKKGKLVEKELLLWVMSAFAFNRFYSRIEEGN